MANIDVTRQFIWP